MRRIAFLLAATASLTVYDQSALADTKPRRSIEYERVAYAICEVDLHKHTVRLYWNRSDGDSLCVSLRPTALFGRRGGPAAIRHQRRHVRFPTSSLWACTWNRGANSCTQTSVRQGQFS